MKVPDKKKKEKDRAGKKLIEHDNVANMFPVPSSCLKSPCTGKTSSQRRAHHGDLDILIRDHIWFKKLIDLKNNTNSC